MQTISVIAEHANAMPAPTWHNLRMNDTTIELAEGLEIAPNITVKEPWTARGPQDEFENAADIFLYLKK